jgi:mannose-6-phosphate isomerase
LNVSAWPISPEPFRIEPIFSPRLWGSRSLAPLFPEMANLPEPIGEAWLTALDCQISGGQFAGTKLGQAWAEMDSAWRGLDFEGQSDFPLLLKFIFPKDKLSIQVHPDDAYAALHEKAAGGRGKTEMWHIFSAEPGARLLAGLKPGTTKEKFSAALANDGLEELFQSHEAHSGDTYFIPAGTPHTIGPNMVICEIQEYSDLTYRVYDYGRVDANGKPRELNVAKALEVIDFNSAPVNKVQTKEIVIRGRKLGEHLIDCSYFEATKFRTDDYIHLKIGRKPAKRFQLWVFLEGEGTIDWSSHPHDFSRVNYGRFDYKPGECWFIPAVFGSRGYQVKGRASVLIATPHNPKLYSRKGSDAI